MALSKIKNATLGTIALPAFLKTAGHADLPAGGAVIVPVACNTLVGLCKKEGLELTVSAVTEVPAGTVAQGTGASEMVADVVNSEVTEAIALGTVVARGDADGKAVLIADGAADLTSIIGVAFSPHRSAVATVAAKERFQVLERGQVVMLCEGADDAIDKQTQLWLRVKSHGAGQTVRGVLLAADDTGYAIALKGVRALGKSKSGKVLVEFDLTDARHG